MTDEKDRIRSDKSELIRALRNAGADIKNEKSFRCCFHDDSTPSAGIVQGDDRAWRVKCHAIDCGFAGDVFDVIAKAGGPSVDDQLKALRDNEPKPQAKPARTWPSIETMKASFAHLAATYLYTNPDTGKVDLIKLRVEVPGEKKTFYQAHVDDSGTVHLRAPNQPYPIYNRTRVRNSYQVIFVEGEKCVHSLADAGYVATTVSTGAGIGKAKASDLTPLAGKMIIIWPDHDPIDKNGKRGGHEFMREVIDALNQLEPAPNIWWIDPERLGLGDKEDVHDYLAKFEPEARADAISDALDIATPMNGATQFNEYLEEIIAGKRRNVAIKSFKVLSAYARPLLPGCVWIIAGDPGTTKSMFVTQILAELLLDQNDPHQTACFMLEDDRNYHMKRCLAQIANNSHLTNEEWIKDHPNETRDAYTSYGDAMKQLERAISDAPDTTPDYKQINEWLAKKAETNRINIIDPVTAIDAGKDVWATDRDFMAASKGVLRKHLASMILVTHSRTGNTKGTIDDIAGGRAFGRFAQCVVWIKRFEPAKPVIVKNPLSQLEDHVEIDREIRILKARNAIGQGRGVGYKFDTDTLKFRELGLILKEKKQSREDE